MISISVCMIVKDEETILARCLNSLSGLYDELIIVDTGSIDHTKEIALCYTDKIYDFKWINDFAAARNFSFSKASCDYIYCADADEVIDLNNHERFLALKKTLLPEIDIIQMYYCNQLQYKTIYNYDKEYRPKLYKRSRPLTFDGPIHESVVLEPVIFDSDIEIMHKPEHSHTDRDLVHFIDAYNRGVRLSKRLHTFYAKELFIAGKDSDFEDAIPVFEDTLKDTARSTEEIKEATCILAHAARLRGDIHTFFTNAIKNIASDGCSEICYELGTYYYNLKEYDEAIIWYYNAAYESDSMLNIHLGSDAPMLALADCYDALGNKEQADIYRREVIDV